MLFRRFGNLPDQAHKVLNAWIIYLALPSVSFKYLPQIQWSTAFLLPVLSPVLVWLGAWLWIHFVVARPGISKSSVGGLKLTTGLANTSFLGFPLVTAYFGEENLGTAVICDQITFFLLSTAGLIVAINSSGKGTLSVVAVAKRVLLFPPFLGFVGALALPLLIDLNPILPVFDKLASTIGPLALFSIGLQLQFEGWKEDLGILTKAIFYKLVLAPLVVLSVMCGLGARGPVAQVALFESCMPSLLSSGIVADQYELNPRLSNLVIGVSILISFGTTYAWSWVITAIL